MKVNVAREVAALKRMTVKELRGRYLDVFGETTRSGNKDWLRKRIAWRIQANAHGDLSERARRRAAELADDRYKNGLEDFETVLEAQRARLSFEDQLVQSQSAVTQNLINLYKALGGGWTSLGSDSH